LQLVSLDFSAFAAAAIETSRMLLIPRSRLSLKLSLFQCLKSAFLFTIHVAGCQNVVVSSFPVRNSI
jgi:hypothetical protein